MLSRKLGFKTPLAERFWQKVDKRGPDDCWMWLGAKVGGYGTIWNGKKVIGAHRASLILDGRDPGLLDALHSCHNPSCVNPSHLRPGTEKENAQDAIKARRFVHRHPGFGEKNVNAVLTEMDVRMIRDQYTKGTTLGELGRQYNVSRGAIAKCVHHKTWKNVA